MGKNILILSGGPRKGGNSETLCAQFAKGRMMDGLRGLTDCIPNARVRGRIYGAGAWRLTPGMRKPWPMFGRRGL